MALAPDGSHISQQNVAPRHRTTSCCTVCPECGINDDDVFICVGTPITRSERITPVPVWPRFFSNFRSWEIASFQRPLVCVEQELIDGVHRPLSPSPSSPLHFCSFSSRPPTMNTTDLGESSPTLSPALRSWEAHVASRLTPTESACLVLLWTV